jgi:hypothetical protein
VTFFANVEFVKKIAASVARSVSEKPVYPEKSSSDHA